MSDVGDFVYLVIAAFEQSTFPELTAALPAIGKLKWTTLQSIMETHAELVKFARKGIETQSQDDQIACQNGIVKYCISNSDLGYEHLITYPQARNQEEYRAYLIYKDGCITHAVEYDDFAKKSVHYHLSDGKIDLEVHSSPNFSVKTSSELIKIIVDVVDCSYVVILDRSSRRVTVERGSPVR